MDAFELTAADGRSIPVCRWMPVIPARGVVLVSHGMSEYAARYDRLARTLVEAGYAVYAHDHRGHGARAEVRGLFAVKDGWQRVLGDLDNVRRRAEDDNPGLPLFVFGHSMGSFIARAHFLSRGEGLAGLVLSATGYRQSAMARVMRAVAGLAGRGGRSAVASPFMAKLVFGSFNLGFVPARTPVDWLSRDRDEVDRYRADALCGFAPTPSLWSDLFGGILAMEREEKAGRGLNTGCPVLLFAGSRDPVSLGAFGLGQLARRYRQAGLADVTVKVYPGGRHEMHNETNREDVEADLIAWLDAHRPATQNHAPHAA
ncbi:alpha/beta hydrolase [Paludibacterium paludis]|uniref:Alpha/beta hydrolase n=1 Tax=Paludibacterium paludis TaxID=1225769 RepID=A0A918NZQ6_9NEIS|nr:alpha/beta hydrolase [Paludibacterium paludis]GGY09672.1 alpha/beta hydrolase [Paludibacterium paludis]